MFLTLKPKNRKPLHHREFIVWKVDRNCRVIAFKMELRSNG